MELENFDVMNFAKCQFSLFFLKGDLKVEATVCTILTVCTVKAFLPNKREAFRRPAHDVSIGFLHCKKGKKGEGGR